MRVTWSAGAAALALVLTCSGQDKPFGWPQGKRAAISLTFDDARPSQIDTGLPLLEKHGVKATFFVSPRNLEKRLEGWRRAVARGHEIGNHSLTHPCTANYGFSRDNALEEYDLERMRRDLDGAQAEIRRLLGVAPVSFAYPCGLKFVGRGKSVRSYVPLVEERFVLGRGYLDEAANDPRVCDPAQAMGTAFDDMGPEQVLRIAAAAAREGQWVLFTGHGIGPRAYQSTSVEALEALIAFAQDPAHGIWLEAAGTVASYVRRRRRGRADEAREMNRGRQERPTSGLAGGACWRQVTAADGREGPGTGKRGD